MPPASFLNVALCKNMIFFSVPYGNGSLLVDILGKFNFFFK